MCFEDWPIPITVFEIDLYSTEVQELYLGQTFAVSETK